MRSPPTGAPNTRGVGKTCSFQLVTLMFQKQYKLDTFFSVKNEQNVVCTLSNADIDAVV